MSADRLTRHFLCYRQGFPSLCNQTHGFIWRWLRRKRLPTILVFSPPSLLRPAGSNSSMGLDRFALHLARRCMMPSMKPDVVDATLPPRRACWLLLAISLAAFAWSLPRPFLQDVVVGRAGDSPDATSV